MRSFFFHSPLSRAARQLQADAAQLGRDVDREAVTTALHAIYDEESLAEQLAAWAQPAVQRMVRTRVLARLAGVESDWRLRAPDVLAQVNRCVGGAEPAVIGQVTPDGTLAHAGRTYTVQHITLQHRALAGPIRWRCSGLPGLMDAVNHVLGEAGEAGRFAGLATDGDYYAYVYGRPDAMAQLARAGAVALSGERDPVSGPLPAGGGPPRAEGAVRE
ncbi:MAG TPA: hypothetical protein VFS11_11225 [Gemmatimonadales bacterium]|nr:hypothetical protein [Gemmatimonadales bacterium]